MSWTFDEHASHIAALVPTSGIETVALDDALGRVTAERVTSPVDLPLFRNSQMDGFAVRAADVAHAPVSLPVAGEVAARPSDPPPLRPGTAVRIMTGAVLPEGADAVIPVEDTLADTTSVSIARGRAAGEYVRERGSDVRAGDELLAAGVRLGSRHLAVLAAAGLASVEVRARLSIAIITTGSELIEPGATPTLGQVFDSNGTALAAAVRAAGAVVHSRTHVADDVAAMERALDAAAAADLIVTSGGISAGDYEVVREALEPHGARVGHVAMQPGGPQATAAWRGTPVICFPGNPVSTQLSFEVFLAPVLRAGAGLPAAFREWAILNAPIVSMHGKRQFFRGRSSPDGSVTLVGGPSSHLVAGLAASDVLIVVPEDITRIAADETVETWTL